MLVSSTALAGMEVIARPGSRPNSRVHGRIQRSPFPEPFRFPILRGSGFGLSQPVQQLGAFLGGQFGRRLLDFLYGAHAQTLR